MTVISPSPNCVSTHVHWRRSRADLSNLADPLARALCWAALWDLTRDSEMPAREFVELVARHVPEREGFAAGRAGHQPGTRRRSTSTVTPPTAPPPVTGSTRSPSTQVTSQTLGARAAPHLVAHPRRHRRRSDGVTGAGRARSSTASETHPRHRARHRPALADHGSARRGGQGRRCIDPGDHGRGPERHRAASRHGLSRRPADGGRQRRGVAARRRRERADARGLEGARPMASSRSRPCRRSFAASTSAPSGWAARWPTAPILNCSVRMSSATSTRSPRYGRSAPSTKPQRSPSACYPSHLVDDRVGARPSTMALESGALPVPRFGTLREGRDSTLRAQRAREVDRAAGV